ncbi:hypothetical protein RB597_007774 [Gaeumannomyces tritici]
MALSSYDGGQPTDLAALWDQALTSYSERTSVDIRKAMQPQKSINSIMMDQQQLLQAFSGFRHNKGKTDKLRTVVARNADVIQSVAALVANAASGAFPPAATVLTAFTYVLNASKHVSDDYNAILGFFDLMNSFLERLSLLEGKLPRLPAFQKFVVHVFSSMLHVSGIARGYCLKGRFMKWAKALVEGSDEELQGALDSLNENLRRLESAMLMQTLRTAIETHDEARAAKDGVSALTGHVRELQGSLDKNTAMTEQTLVYGERAMNAALETGAGIKDLLVSSHEGAAMGQTLLRQQAQIRLSLERMQGGRKVWALRAGGVAKTPNLEQLRAYLPNAGEGAMRARLDELELANPRMFQWVETEPLFEEFAEERSRSLWLSGKSGMGKSTVCFKMLQLLRDRVVEEQNAYVVAYFFEETSAGVVPNDWESDINKMIHWVGIKVAEQDTHYRDELLTALRRGVWPIADDYYWQNVIQDRFSKSASRRLVLILDGVDLLKESDRMALLNLLQLVESEGLRVQFVLAGDSKMEPALERLGERKIALTKEKLASDFRKLAIFRSKELPRLRGLRVSFRKIMVRKVAHMADNFLYIEHTMRRFNSLRREALILKELEHLPESITQLYETLINECKRGRTPDELEVLRSLFAWLAYANSEVTIAEASKIIAIVAQENSISIEEELDGRSSRLLRISRSQDDGDTKAQDSDVSDSDNSDSKPDDHGAGDDRGADNILGFQERSLRAFFRQAGENDRGLKCSPSEAHAIILRISIAILRTSCEEKLYSEELARYSAANWSSHFLAIDRESISDALAAEVLESIHSLLSNKNSALRQIEFSLPPSATVLDGEEQVPGGESSTVIHCLQAWARRALKLPPGVLPYGLADWYRPLAAEPARAFITLARSHINNWFSAEGTIDAYSSFHAAQNALRAGSHLPELRQNPGLSQYFERHPEEDEADVESFEVVANAFWDIVKTSASHRGIARAMKMVELWEPAIAQLDTSLSLVEEGANKEGERYDVMSSKGDAILELAQSLAVSDPDRAKELMGQAVEILAEALRIRDAQIAQNPDVIKTKEGTFAAVWLWSVLSNHALACAGIGDFDASLASIKRFVDYKEWRIPMGFLEKIIRSMVNGDKASLVIVLLKSVSPGDRLALFQSSNLNSPMFRAVKKEGECEAMLELLDSASQYAAERKAYHSRAQLLDLAAQFAWSVMGRDEDAKDRLRTLLAEPQIPSTYMGEAAELLSQLLYEQFRRSPAPNTKNSALEELRGVRGRLEADIADFNPARSDTVVPLALMLRKLGPALDYADTLQAAFSLCIEGLKDDTGANDFQSLRLLAKVLMCVDGLERDAQIAYTVQQYILDDDVFRRDEAESRESDEGADLAAGQQPEGTADGEESEKTLNGEEKGREEKEPRQEQNIITPGPEDEKPQQGAQEKDNEAPAAPSATDKATEPPPPTLEDEIHEGLLPDTMREIYICDMCHQGIWEWGEGASYYCVQCTQVDLCAACMASKLARERGEPDPSPSPSGIDWRVICPEGHRHVKGPVEGWRGVRNGRMRIGDEETPVKQWIADLEARWAAYWKRYWSESLGD